MYTDTYPPFTIMFYVIRGPSYPFWLSTNAARIFCSSLRSEVEPEVGFSLPVQAHLKLTILPRQFWYISINRPTGSPSHPSLRRKRGFSSPP
jgi:hypothetical protein